MSSTVSTASPKPLESVLHNGNKIYKKRRTINRVMLTLSLITLAFGLFWLFWICLLYTSDAADDTASV